jgi:phosphomevalonate kinase
MSHPSYHLLTVPGNLLLAGEYAVLVEGGLGLACAVEPRVHVTWHPSDRLKIRARFEDQRILWTPEGTDPVPLLDHLWAILATRVGAQLTRLRYMVTLDSTNLTRADGRKSGLGSSAAAVVAATAALWYLATEIRPSQDDVFQTALAAHRLAQGSRGSGYDLACSTYGGMGLFTGGKAPTWTPLSRSHLPTFTLISAPRPVSTRQAISRWDQWKETCPEVWEDYLHQSQKIVSSLALSQDRLSFETALAEAAALGQGLGQNLGVWDPINDTFMAAQKKTGLCKALGAGNELLAQWHDKCGSTQSPVTAKGLQWY